MPRTTGYSRVRLRALRPIAVTLLNTTSQTINLRG